MSEVITNAPKLVTTSDICKAIPSIKPRTLRLWIQKAQPQEVSEGGRRRTIEGNGLGGAVIRKGGLILIDWDRFLEWLYEGRSA